jgi:glycosyltransferase involved in cell wall biosynthesis
MISIITPSLNRADFIADAIESTQKQNYRHFEQIIVDGGSNDTTMSILSHYPQLRVVSEKDTGMYDALNKGLKLAGGEIIGFLNSDDRYAENIFSEVEQMFTDDQIYAVVGEALVYSETSGNAPKIVEKFSPEGADLLELATLGSPFFNAWFFRRSVFEKIGCFNTDYQIVADREFMLRFAQYGLEYATIKRLVYQYRRHEGAMTFEITDQKLERIVREHHRMANEFLRQPDLPQRARRLIIEAHTQDTITMAIRSLRKADLRKAIGFFALGMQADFTWGAKFGKRVLDKMIRWASFGRNVD